MEEGKDPTAVTVSKPNQSKVLPPRLIQLLFLFLVLCFSICLFVLYMIRKTEVTTTLVSSIPVLQPCVQEQQKTNLDHWIKPPSSLLHAMSDEELFWRASFVPQLKNYPFARVPKIAFMFLTKGPLPFAPLWERFFKGHEGLYSVYIHSFPSYEAKFPPESVFYGRQIPSQATNLLPLLIILFHILLITLLYIHSRLGFKKRASGNKKIATDFVGGECFTSHAF